MTTFAFPTLTRRHPQEWTFGQTNNALVHTSPLSKQVQTVELPGARWACSMRYRNLTDVDRALLDAFLAQLRGHANRFTLYDFSKSVPSGTMRGSLTTSGSTAAGATSCVITGGGGQASTTLLAGDKLNIGGELKMVVANATANGSGVITVTVEPPFRGTIGNGVGVVWERPTALFISVSPDWQAELGQALLANFAFDGVEVYA